VTALRAAQNAFAGHMRPRAVVFPPLGLPSQYRQTVAARGEIGREGCEISSLLEYMGLLPWLFL